VSAPGGSAPLLEVRNLTVRFRTRDGVVQAVTDLSFTLRRGETLGVVGESGSGKSVTSLAIMGLLNRAHADVTGQILFEGVDLLTLKPSELRRIRGRDVSMIFQDPFACLHPMYRVGDQIAEAVKAHASVSRAKARERAVEMLDAVGIPNAAIRARDYPHQYSGGMRQRAMIAMALVHNPAVLIADEPTTALDVTVQAQILELIDRVKREFNVGVILITHDLGVIAETATNVMVMYGGRAHRAAPSCVTIRSRQISRLRSLSRWQASAWPPAIAASAGTTVSQRPNRCGQRGWNTQPVGGCNSDGGEPSIGTSAASRRSTLGIDSSRPQV